MLHVLPIREFFSLFIFSLFQGDRFFYIFVLFFLAFPGRANEKVETSKDLKMPAVCIDGALCSHKTEYLGSSHWSLHFQS